MAAKNHVQDHRSPKTIQDLLQLTKEFFAQRGIESARLDAEVLLAHVLSVERLRLYLDWDKPLSESEINAYREVVRRRGKREPVAYITGVREFYGLPIEVSPAVMVPRPDTETLIEVALELLPEHTDGTIVDVGTGSGCIAIVLAQQRPKIRVIATDISEAAVLQARKNVNSHGFGDRIDVRLGDLLEPVMEEALVTAIVSNPPYVLRDMAPELMEDVVSYEPELALFGAGADGLGHHRRLVSGARSLLEPRGFLIMEFGIGQESQMKALGDSGFARAEIHPDLSGIPRVAMFQRDGSADHS